MSVRHMSIFSHSNVSLSNDAVHVQVGNNNNNNNNNNNSINIKAIFIFSTKEMYVNSIVNLNKFQGELRVLLYIECVNLDFLCLFVYASVWERKNDRWVEKKEVGLWDVGCEASSRTKKTHPAPCEETIWKTSDSLNCSSCEA